MKFSFLIFLTCVVVASTTKTDAESQVLHDKKLILKIASYLPNPFLNLAKVSKAHWTLFRELTPAPLLATRFDLKEALILKDFDADAKLFFTLNRRIFMCMVSSYLLEPKRTKYLRLSDKTKKVLVTGAARFMIRREYKYSASVTEKMLKHVFHALIEQEEYPVAIELLNSFKVMLVPSTIVDEAAIHCLLKEFPSLKTENMARFLHQHVPAIFSFILKQQQDLDQTKFALGQLESAFLANSTHFSNLITLELCDKIASSMKEPVDASAFDFIYNRNLVLLNWISRTGQTKNSPVINFLIDMNFVRFNLPAPSAVQAGNIFKKWMRINASYYNEIILNIALQAPVFLEAVKTCLSRPASKEFKFALRQHPDIIRQLSSEDLLKLHSLDHLAVAETFSLINIVPPTVEQLNELDSSHLSQILINLCAGSYDLTFDRRFALLEAILDILPSKQEACEECKGSVLIVEDFFISIASDDSKVSVLKKIYKVFWRIESVTLANLLRPENRFVFKNLKDAQVFNYICVNLFDLVPLVSLEDWTDRLCPLFTLNPQNQFERVNGFMWPPNEEIVKEIDSVLEGKRPVLDFLKDSNNCNILPRLAYNSILKQLNASSLLKLWSRGCLVTFILFVPDSLILSIINKENAIKKWLKRRPDDDQFNWRFASVFLDKNVGLVFESKSLSELEYNYTLILPFINKFKPAINAKIDSNIKWKSVLSDAKSVEDFEKIVRLVSHRVTFKAFEEDPKLQTEFKQFYQLLLDFDFVCSIDN